MRNFVNLVYSQSILKGLVTTYANTETIIEGVISQKSSYQILCEINKSIEQDLMFQQACQEPQRQKL